MQAQLQDGRDAPSSLRFDLGKGIDVPRIEHQRLFANRVSVRAQRETAMGVVQIVGRAYRDVVDLLAAPAQQVDVAIEALELDEEVGIGEVVVDDADGVFWIECDFQLAADGTNSPHVTWRNVTRGPDERERRYLSPHHPPPSIRWYFCIETGS